MADGLVVVNEINFKCNFRALSNASPVFLLRKINSYQPIVSDVSDDDLMETVKQIEKSENVISPTPKSTRTMPFDAFKTTRGWQSCSTRKSVKATNIY